MEDSSASESADDEGETRGTKRAHGGKFGPELEEKPHKAARKTDTVSPGQSRKDADTGKPDTRDSWTAGSPARHGARKLLLDRRSTAPAAPKVPFLKLPVAGSSDVTAMTPDTSSTSTPVVITTVTLPSNAKPSAHVHDPSPRGADAGETGASSGRAESPRVTIMRPRGRPQSPRTLSITGSSAAGVPFQPTKGAPPTPAKGQNVSGGMPSSDASSARRTIAEQLGLDLSDLPGAPAPHTASSTEAQSMQPASQRDSQISQEVLDELDDLLDTAINANPFTHKEKAGSRKEQEKERH